MVEEFFMSYLIWIMFGLGLLLSIRACDNWMSRFFFAWSMVFAYLVIWGVLWMTVTFCVAQFGAEHVGIIPVAGRVIAIALIGLYAFQFHAMRGGPVAGVGGGGGKRGASPRNPFRKSFH